VTVGREEEVARQLHGERGGSLGAVAGSYVVHKGAADAQYIDSPVGFEALVFIEMTAWRRMGQTVVADHLAAFQRKRADDAALSVVKVGQGGGR